MNRLQIGVVLGIGGAIGFGCAKADTDEKDPTATAGAGGVAAVAGNGGTAGETMGIAGAGGASGGAGGTDPASAGGGAGGEAPVDREPMLLSATGLYSDIASKTLAPGVMEFQPQFQLWSDAATKRRWVQLPEGSKIISSNMDFWRYPDGTKFWKEFSRDGVPLETRLLWKHAAGDWYMMAYQWNAEGTEATAVPDGVPNAAGTTHDIPTQEDCATCHSSMPDNAIGFSAIELSHDLGGVNLDQLVAMDLLTNPPTAPFTMPGTPVEQAALGYLHANCGMCHNPRGKVFLTAMIDMDLWQHYEPAPSVAESAAYLSMVNRDNRKGPIQGSLLRIAPGDVANSSVYQTMLLRDAHADAGIMVSADGGIESLQMPPIGSEIPDPDGLAAIEAWILSIQP